MLDLCCCTQLVSCTPGVIPGLGKPLLSRPHPLDLEFIWTLTQRRPGLDTNTSHVHKNKRAGAAAATTTTATSSPGAATSPPNATSSSIIDPDAIPQSAPSSHLASSTLSNVTGSSSVSHGKRKVESVSSTSCKRTCPRTATAQAQLDGSAAIQDIATAFKDISHSFDYGMTHPPATDLSSAVTLLGRHTELSTEDVVLLAEYFSQPQNLSQATVF